MVFTGGNIVGLPPVGWHLLGWYAYIPLPWTNLDFFKILTQRTAF